MAVQSPVQYQFSDGSFTVKVEVIREREDSPQAPLRKELEEQVRQADERAARAQSEQKELAREVETLRNERNELQKRRREDGVSECVICNADWSDAVVRHAFECGHAVACAACCDKWVTVQEPSKPGHRLKQRGPYRCPVGCDLSKKRFRPVFLG